MLVPVGDKGQVGAKAPGRERRSLHGSRRPAVVGGNRHRVKRIGRLGGRRPGQDDEPGIATVSTAVGHRVRAYGGVVVDRMDDRARVELEGPTLAVAQDVGEEPVDSCHGGYVPLRRHDGRRGQDLPVLVADLGGPRLVVDVVECRAREERAVDL